MAKTREQKEETVKLLTDKLSKMKSLVFVNFDGLKVAEVTKLRKQCRKEKVDYIVAKKTLLKKALDGAKIEDIDPKTITGGIATVLSYEDEVAPAKILYEFAKDHQALKISGGFLEGKFIAAVAIANLAKLPSRNELMAKVVGSIAAPLSDIVGVLQGNLRNLVGVLQAIKERK